MRLVLVDRDGVINEEIPGFITHPNQLCLFPQALDALALLARAGCTVAVVTNQSAIGRGLLDVAGLGAIHAALLSQVRATGGLIDRIFFCPDAPEQASYRRKPKPGMLLEAIAHYQAEPDATPFVGDAVSDMEAAFAAGCPRYLVLTGKGRASGSVLPPALHPVTICDNLLAAARRIAG